MVSSGLVPRLLSLTALVLAAPAVATTCTAARDIAAEKPALNAARDAKAIAEIVKVRETALAIGKRQGHANDAAVSSLGQDLRSQFDAVGITQAILGPFWERATAGERHDAVQAFSDILAQAAVTQFVKHRSLPFAVREVLHLRDGDLVVVSEFAQSDGRKVRVDWRLSRKNDTMKIVDLAVDAKSMIVKYRHDADHSIRAKDNSVRAFIVSLRERLPTTVY